MILTTADFVGKYAIPDENPYLQNDLTFVEKTEKAYLKRLLGFESYKEFKENTQSDKWQPFIEGFEYEYNNKLYELKGFRDVLIGFAYYEIMSEMFSLPTSSGLVTPNYENAEKQAKFEWQRKIFNSFNESLSIYNNLAMYFYQNNTLITKTATSIIDNGDGTYTVNLSDTSDLLNFSRVKMSDGKYYTVSDLIENTSFKITAEAGKSFGNEFSFYKYNNIRTSNIAYKKMVYFG